VAIKNARHFIRELPGHAASDLIWNSAVQRLQQRSAQVVGTLAQHYDKLLSPKSTSASTHAMQRQSKRNPEHRVHTGEINVGNAHNVLNPHREIC
jgi:uncharacterized membrane-anchored protein YhcB (DUF1043 family)